MKNKRTITNFISDINNSNEYIFISLQYFNLHLRELHSRSTRLIDSLRANENSALSLSQYNSSVLHQTPQPPPVPHRGEVEQAPMTPTSR